MANDKKTVVKKVSVFPTDMKSPRLPRGVVSGKKLKQKATDYTESILIKDSASSNEAEQSHRKRVTMRNNPVSGDAQRSARTGDTVNLMNKRAKAKKLKEERK